jgi:hypothetical protein
MALTVSGGGKTIGTSSVENRKNRIANMTPLRWNATGSAI